MTSTDPNREGAGRLMYLRGVWLMVNHVDRIHKKIEEILAVLRAQTHMQVQIEATFLQFTDNFMKDVGVQWSNLPVFNVGSSPSSAGISPLRPAPSATTRSRPPPPNPSAFSRWPSVPQHGQDRLAHPCRGVQHERHHHQHPAPDLSSTPCRRP